MIARDLGRTGDRRAIPVLVELNKHDITGKVPGETSRWALADLLNHGSDEQLRKDAESNDDVVAPIAKSILANPASYGLIRPKPSADSKQ